MLSRQLSRVTKTIWILLAAVLVSGALLACFKSDTESKPVGPDQPPPGTGPGTETGNPGLLLNAQGLRLAGVKIRIWTAPESTLSAAGIPQIYSLFDSATSDTAGKFRYQQSDSGAMVLEAVAIPEELGRAIPLVRRDAKDTSVLRLNLQTLGTLRGTVTRGGPWPLAGLEDDAGILVQLIEIGRFSTTKANGAIQFDQVPPGNYSLAAYALDGHFSPYFVRNVTISENALLTLDTIHLNWSPAVQPPPVRGIAARWDSSAQSGKVAWWPVPLSDLAGYVIWSAAPGGELLPMDTVIASVNTYALSTGQFLSDSLRVSVTCFDSAGNAGPFPDTTTIIRPQPQLPTDQAMISGRVLGSDGHPAALATIRVFWFPAADTGKAFLADSTRFLFSTSTNAQGEYRLAVPRARLVLEALENGGQQYKALTPVFIPATESMTLAEISLGPTGNISGTLSRGGICVACNLKQDEFLWIWSRQGPYVATTDNTGKYTLSGIPVGYHDLVVLGTPEGWFNAKVLKNIRVQAGLTTQMGKDTVTYDTTKSPPAPRWSQTVFSRSSNLVTLQWYSARPITQSRLTRREGLPPKSVFVEQIQSAISQVTVAVDTLASGTWFDFTVDVMDANGRFSQRIVTPTWQR